MGQSIVELALALPVILALLVVGIDTGRAYYFGTVVIDAAAAGARQAAETPMSDATIDGAALDAAPSGLLTTSDVAISGTRTSGQAMTVTVTYSFVPVTPFARAIVGSTVTISHAVTARVR